MVRRATLDREENDVTGSADSLDGFVNAVGRTKVTLIRRPLGGLQ
jgi:hypothetical protein